MKKIKKIIIAHKLASGGTAIMLALLGYWAYGSFTSTDGETRYVTATAEKGTLIVSITGSGQVSASNQVDLKPKASGEVVYIGVQNSQEVRMGALIAQLDARDAQKTVRDAEANLESAKLSLEKLQKPADNLSLIQSQNALDRAKESKQNAEDDLVKAYDDGFNTISNAFLDLPAIMTGLQDLLFSTTAGLGLNGQWNIDYYANVVEQYDAKVNEYKQDASNKYSAARTAYDKNFQDYKSTNRSSDTKTVESLIDETYEATKSVAEAVKSSNNLIQFYKDTLTGRNLKPSSVSDTHLATLNTYTGKTNSHLINLLSAKNTIQNSKDAIVNADRSIAENTESLAKLKAGADALDLDSARLTVRQRENALLDAKEKLADYYIRAPFDGTIAKIDIKKSDSVTGSTIAATLITKQKLAEISLNEIDAAKIKVGQKATLTFDAVEGLTIAGSVAEIDTVGTVTQGVVTYAVKIGFGTQDDRVKPGMSVSAAIVTNIKQDALMVPNSAIKSRGEEHYVEMFDSPLAESQSNQGAASTNPPRQQTVEIGISNDTSTEIISGIKEGDQVVTRTITSTSQTTTQQAPSLFGAPRGR